MDMIVAYDNGGLRHLKFRGVGTIEQAVRLALSVVNGAPTWFWFNGTFAPMFVGDDARALSERWTGWRESYQRDPCSTRELLQALTVG